jgi:hypothetical protein
MAPGGGLQEGGAFAARAWSQEAAAAGGAEERRCQLACSRTRGVDQHPPF